MNRIHDTFQNAQHPLLAVYLTAGFPRLTDTLDLCEAVQDAGADIIEIGMPFSDPLADGPVIQDSSQRALANGMSLEVLFGQLATLRPRIHVPVLLMGYLNPVMQYGIERFAQRCHEVGVDGIIVPDMPFAHFQQHYAALFRQHQLANVFLITPQTTPERIAQIDAATTGFIYMVSSAGTTGNTTSTEAARTAYFQRVAAMPLQHPRLIGFGVATAADFRQAAQYAQGAIVGTALIRAIDNAQPAQSARQFVAALRG